MFKEKLTSNEIRIGTSNIGKATFRELSDLKSYGLPTFDLPSLGQEKVKIRDIGCKFLRHQSLKYFLRPSLRTNLH